MALKLTTLLTTLLIVVGCQTAPYKTQYTLGTAIDSNIPVSNVQKPYSIAISDVKTFGSGMNTDMTYSRSANIIESYTKSEWAEPPVNLIKVALANALIASGAYKDVLMEPTTISSPYKVDATLQSMQQVFQGNQNSIELSLMVRLVNTATHQVVFSKVYRATEVASSQNAEGGVEAYNRALSLLLPSIVRDINAH